VRRFLGAAHAAGALRRGMRIGHIGQRIDFFWTTIVNESELLERFRVEVLPIDLVEFIDYLRGLVVIARGEILRAAPWMVSLLDSESALLTVRAERVLELHEKSAPQPVEAE